MVQTAINTLIGAGTGALLVIVLVYSVLTHKDCPYEDNDDIV